MLLSFQKRFKIYLRAAGGHINCKLRLFPEIRKIYTNFPNIFISIILCIIFNNMFSDFTKDSILYDK